MMPAIQQSVRFRCSPETLYEMYMDSSRHTAATGSKARISRRIGGKFTAFDGALSGRNLLLIPNQLIVQAWKSANWKPTDPDSILVLQFSKVDGGCRVDMVHANVPVQDHRGVTKGWPKFYWIPWKAYLAQQQRQDKNDKNNMGQNKSRNEKKNRKKS